MQRVQHLLSQLDQTHPLKRVHSSNQTIGSFGHHDLGANNEFIDQQLHKDVSSLTYWERKIDAFVVCLVRKKLFNVSEMRKQIELIPKKSYLTIAYYEKWLFATIQLLLNKTIITENELISKYRNHNQINKLKSLNTPKYKIGDVVQIRNVCDSNIQYENWRLFLGLNEKSHVRAPGYIVGKTGIIQSYLGMMKNDELTAFGIHAQVPIYKIRFKQKDIYSQSNINENDSIDVEVVSHWLQNVPEEHKHNDNEEHIQEHSKHEKREIVEKNAINKEPNLSPYEVLSEVIISLCCEKRLVSMNDIREKMEAYDMAKQLNLAPKIVIKAWKDAAWKKRLIDESNDGNALALIAETFDVEHLKEDTKDFILKVVENDTKTHNVICCTLCSCYPRVLIGLPPHWYKSLRYRSEIISKPRELLRTEFGCNIPLDMTLRVHDSTSDIRYIVLPHPSQIPNYKQMSDGELEKIITRDMIIGVKR